MVSYHTCDTLASHQHITLSARYEANHTSEAMTRPNQPDS